MPGNIQIPDTVAVPGIVFLKGDLLQTDVLLILEGFCAKDHDIVCMKDHVSTGNKNLVPPLDGGHDDPFRQTDLSDAVVYPGIPFCQMDLDEMDIRFLTIFTHPFDTGILVNESCGNNTGRDGNHAHAEKGDEDTEYLSQSGNGINISVPNGQQSGRGPPDSGECVGKYLRLSLMLQAVHAQTGCKHEHKDDKYRREELLFLACNDLGDHTERIIVRIDPEKPEDPDNPEHAESNCSRWKKDREVIRQKGKQIHKSGKGCGIFPDRSALIYLRVEELCCPQS